MQPLFFVLIITNHRLMIKILLSRSDQIFAVEKDNVCVCLRSEVKERLFWTVQRLQSNLCAEQKIKQFVIHRVSAGVPPQHFSYSLCGLEREWETVFVVSVVMCCVYVPLHYFNWPGLSLCSSVKLKAKLNPLWVTNMLKSQPIFSSI